MGVKRVYGDRLTGQWIVEAFKRIFAPTKVPTRLREAGEQLRRSLRDEPATARGIVAISLSRLLSQPRARLVP